MGNPKSFVKNLFTLCRSHSRDALDPEEIQTAVDIAARNNPHIYKPRWISPNRPHVHLPGGDVVYPEEFEGNEPTDDYSHQDYPYFFGCHTTREMDDHVRRQPRRVSHEDFSASENPQEILRHLEEEMDDHARRQSRTLSHEEFSHSTDHDPQDILRHLEEMADNSAEEANEYLHDLMRTP